MAKKDRTVTHDPQDEETLARLLCEAADCPPDTLWPYRPTWEAWRLPAQKLQRIMQAKGWKITSPDATPAQAQRNDPTGNLPHVQQMACEAWRDMHDAAPICPRDNTGND